MNESSIKEVISLFPTPVVKVNINRNFTESEMQCITDIPLEKKNKDGEIMSNYRSENYYLFEDSPNLKDIKIFCESNLKHFLEDVEGVDTDKANLKITQSWLNKIKPQEFQQVHTHPNSHLSGVLYINCLPNDSINFKNRSSGFYNSIEFPIKKITIWNSSTVKVGIEEGDLIIFPSWMIHHVDKNNTDKERISLAFNTFPIGEMGNYKNITHLFLK